MNFPKQSQEPDFWMQIYSHCTYLNETCVNQDNAKELVIEQLRTLVEAFDKNFDPTDQFEEYMVLMLCKAVVDKLE